MRLTASLPILTLLSASVRPAIFLTPRSPRIGTSLEDRFFHVARHALVALKYLSYELALPIPRNLKALYLASRSNQVTDVVAVALSPPGGGELPVAGFEVLGHLFLEHLLQHRLDALADR